MKSYSGGIRQDYKDTSIDASVIQRRHWPWFFIGLLLPLVAVLLFLASGTNESMVPPPTTSIVRGTSIERPLVLPEAPPTAAALLVAGDEEYEQEASTRLSLTVQSGDSMELLFRRNGLDLADLAAMSGLSDAREHLRMVRPGDTIDISHAAGRVLTLAKELDEVRVLQVDRDSTGFTAAILQRDVDIRPIGAHGVIQNSLFEAGLVAGISDSVTMNMAGIFQWDIDFIQDVRVGDEFTVIHEELWRDGVKLRDGEIVAAEFINQPPGRPARS